MADITYTAGSDEDHIIKWTETDQDLDLSNLIAEFIRLKGELQSLPKIKTVPDQDTLDFWNNYVLTEVVADKDRLDNEVIILYNEAKAIRDVGLLPSKYYDEYDQLENYVNNL